MRKIQTYILTKRDKVLARELVTAYTRDNIICFHRDAFNKNRWKLTDIFSGLSDGKEYKSREDALVHYCDEEWHYQVLNACKKLSKSVMEYPVHINTEKE